MKIFSAPIAKFKALSALEKAYVIALALLSCLIVATAVCFIVSCVSIYQLGNSPFSRERVAEYFARIAPLTYITLTATVAVGVLSLYAKGAKEPKIPNSKAALLRIIEGRLASYELSEEFSAVRSAERKRRRLLLIITAAICTVFAAVALIFILNPARYQSDDYNLDIAYSVVIGFSSALLSFAACYVTSRLFDMSYSAETEAAKLELGRAKGGELATRELDSEIENLKKNEGHTVMILRAAVLAVAVTFIILGVFNGGMADVLGKAVRICTECIGLG